jgi:hypothetical protein
MSSFGIDPDDPHVLVAHDHSLLSGHGIKAVRQPSAISRDLAQEIISIPDNRLREACIRFAPFYEAAKAPKELKGLLPYEFLRECGALQESFAKIRSTTPVITEFLYDTATTRPHARSMHIEQIFYPHSKKPVGTIRARNLIMSFSEASLAQPKGGETEMVMTKGLTPEQIRGMIGNTDPIGSPSHAGINVQSIDACEALSFWGDSLVDTDPHQSYLVHRARPAGSKRLSLAIGAQHPIDGFDI